jgi:hypothetical protein
MENQGVGMMKVSQLLDMQHAIGYTTEKVKRKKFTAYRNYFTTSKPNEDWDDLVSQEYAEREPYPRGVGNDPQIYRVTEKGFKELERILHIKIDRSDA